MRRPVGSRIRVFLVEGVIFLAATCASSSAVSQPTTGPPPDWVTAHDVPRWSDREHGSQSGPAYVLLADVQRDERSKSLYFHTAMKILTSEGVQQLSDVSLDYDPSYETLTLHWLRLHRGDATIDKLASTPVETFQRETNMERYVYDGSRTASIHLSDVRIGDVIEYAISRRGQNPAYGDHSFGVQSLDWSIPVELHMLRILVPDDKNVAFSYMNTDITPEVTQHQGYSEYQWTRKEPKAVLYDNNVPAWYNPGARVRYTDFGSWRDVVEWALPLFDISQSERERLRGMAREVLSFSDSPAGILEAIRFVQDHVRYLALVQGMSAYRPHPPTQVWEQRYGDCKDKSLLLCALLGEMGVEAYPMLVSVLAPRSSEDFNVGPGDFNHCVVAFRYNGRWYFVDPTIAYQGGDIDHLCPPDCRFGLIIAPDSDDLTALPVPETGRTVTTEHFTLDEYDGGTLSVVTELRGFDADQMRYYLAVNDLSSIQKENLSYYAAAYPEITAAGALTYSDDRRDSDNVIVVNESYEIDNMWTRSEVDTSASYVEFLPTSFHNSNLWDSSPHRTMPYYVGRVDVRYEFIVDMPEPWFVVPEQVTIAGDAFEYVKQISVEGWKVRVLHEYRRTESEIDAAAVADFVTKHNQIRSKLPVHVFRGLPPAGSGGVNWVMLIVVLAGFAVSLWGALLVFSRYDPQPKVEWQSHGATYERIGGWLIVPAIGLVLAPVRLLSDFVELGGYFNAGVASAFGPAFAALVGFELVVGMAVKMVWWGLLTVAYFKRRSSAPALFIAYCIAFVVYAVVDHMLAGQLMPDSLSGADDRSASRGLVSLLISCSIWVPYFLFSERVKRTFVERGPRYQHPAGHATTAMETAGPAGDEGVRRADELEQLAYARLRDGMPSADVAAWLTGQGLSPGMAAVVVDALAARGTGAARQTPSIPMWVRIVAFAIVMFVIILVLTRS